ncbi:uncharacterized protein LOC142543177 isoform X2 [Primulina tabacum]|uniref:uncharacterized protein LOC142543177 isoform X2 n=1 Tax=Primulina tabacum TaxID=48773 RepID=UPI003F5AD010
MRLAPDLKTLRGHCRANLRAWSTHLGFYFMENLEGRLKDLLGLTGFGSNILNHNISDDFGSMTIEELYPFISYDKRKRIADMFPQDMSANQKQKTGN